MPTQDIQAIVERVECDHLWLKGSFVGTCMFWTQDFELRNQIQIQIVNSFDNLISTGKHRFQPWFPPFVFNRLGQKRNDGALLQLCLSDLWWWSVAWRWRGLIFWFWVEAFRKWEWWCGWKGDMTSVWVFGQRRTFLYEQLQFLIANTDCKQVFCHPRL